MNEEEIRKMIERILRERMGIELSSHSPQGSCPSWERREDASFPVEASARHIHLSREHWKALFGNREAQIKKELSQPGQFQADMRVTLIGSKGVLQNVAVLGPSRRATQVELSMTDARVLGIDAPVRESGHISGSAGIVISAEGKAIRLEEGVIIAKRHIHMKPEDALARGAADGDLVKAQVYGLRPLIFDDVVVRVSEEYCLAMHIDFDEANACGWRPDTRGTIFMGEGGSCQNGRGKAAADKEQKAPGEAGIRLDQKLISEALVKERVGPDATALLIPKRSIITPLAMDALRERNVELKRI